VVVPLCGLGHFRMKAIYEIPQDAFDAWLKGARARKEAAFLENP